MATTGPIARSSAIPAPDTPLKSAPETNCFSSGKSCANHTPSRWPLKVFPQWVFSLFHTRTVCNRCRYQCRALCAALLARRQTTERDFSQHRAVAVCKRSSCTGPPHVSPIRGMCDHSSIQWSFDFLQLLLALTCPAAIRIHWHATALYVDEPRSLLKAQISRLSVGAIFQRHL